MSYDTWKLDNNESPEVTFDQRQDAAAHYECDVDEVDDDQMERYLAFLEQCESTGGK